MAKNYVIYVHTNKVNGKKYVGKTCQDPEQRFGSNGIGYRQCTYFWNAIKKYGWNSFDHEILYKNLTLEEANKKETELISTWKLTDSKYGYNIRQGGDGFDSVTSKSLWSNAEYKNHIRQCNIENWKNYEYRSDMIKRMKEAWKDPKKREDRSNAAKERWKDPEFYNKARESVKKVCARKIVNIETSEVFDCIKDAAEKYGVSDKNAQRAIKNGVRWGGYHWTYYDTSVSA